MEYKESKQEEIPSMESTTFRTFTFSSPNVVPSSPKLGHFDVDSRSVFDTSASKQNIFTFAAPATVSESSISGKSIFEYNTSEKQYKPKISRNAYKPSVNVFTQALRDTPMFEQLKKNSRSQSTKINIENSITCTNVPKALCVKTAAKKYFTAFGNILKISMFVKKQAIMVTYVTKEEATKAYCNCGEYMGEKFNVEWSKSCTSPKSPTKKKDLQKNIVSNLLKTNDDEIKSELEAMMNLEYKLHSDAKPLPENSLLKRVKAKSSSKPALRIEKVPSKTEKLKSENQVSDLLPNATMEELQNIILQTAFTSEDKYKVLEARDRLMRLKQVKSHSLATAKVTSGTCPDMCPEKERLMRESNRQVALYEQLEGSEYRINHMIAVKQYSRSSADQEEPMAHELRPVKSLKMTMSYLLHEIANLCDEPGTNLGEWYHFLWDRTRGIRKDITQQELCCIDSVELVEQCARFHIVCSERLCAEELSVFDKKINSDNLTKCLQSLKYMYHDLRVKSVTCKNEPEFRAYIILLNLNNGNFMWELQRLPASVQGSPEVQFAMEVYSALESNNYYKFFKLVRKTTYLNACILLRYFNQVRLKALSVMVKAYCRTTSTAYPLYELIDILGFEDENEAIYFCEQIGLHVSKDEFHVLLNRQNFSMPVLNIKQNRACNMIESKRVTRGLSIGQCIAGGKMPEQTYKYHKPHSSFDSHGNLIPQSINAEDQNVSNPNREDPYKFIDEDVAETEESKKSQIKTEVTEGKRQANLFKPIAPSMQITPVSTAAKTESSFLCASTKPFAAQSLDNDQIRAIAPFKESTSTIFGAMRQDNVLMGTTRKSETNIFGNKYTAAAAIAKSANIFSKQLETSTNNDVNSPFAAVINKSIFSRNGKGNIFARPATPSTIFNTTATTSSTETMVKSPIATNVVESKSKDSRNAYTTRNELPQKLPQRSTDLEKVKLEELERNKKMRKLNEDTEQILQDLQHEIVQEYCSDIVREEIDRMKSYDIHSAEILDEMLDEIINTVCTNVLINERKLQNILMKIRNRVVLKYVNMWKQYTIKRRQQRVALDDTPVWIQRCSIDECAKLLYTKEQDLVIQNMCKRQHEQIETLRAAPLAPIELIIYAGIKENLKSLDIDTYPNFYWKAIISWPDLQNKSLPLWQHKKIMNQYLCPENYTTDPIVKLYRPNQFETLHICIRHFEGFINDHNLIGADALLFIAAASEDTKLVTKRLMKTVLSRHKLMPISLAFIVLGDGSLEAQSKTIVADLEALLDSGYLSEYTIMFEKNLTEKTILNLTQAAMLWLSVNKSPLNPLEMDYLKDVYDTCLTEELWLRILGDSSFNTKLSLALRDPNFIISLYNEAVTHLMDIILDPESFMYTKFAPEFKKFLKDRYTMPCSYEYFDDFWRGEDYKAMLESVMYSFILPRWKYSWPVKSAVVLRQNVIQYCKEALADLNSDHVSSGILSNLSLTSGDSTVVNFIDILLYILKEKIRVLGDGIKVVYNRNHIKHFRSLPWWFKSNVLMEYLITAEMTNLSKEEKENNDQEPIMKRRRLNKHNETISRCNDSLNELEPLAEFCEITRNQVMEVHATSKEVENRLKTQQLENSLLEEKIRNAVFGNTAILHEKT